MSLRQTLKRCRELVKRMPQLASARRKRKPLSRKRTLIFGALQSKDKLDDKFHLIANDDSSGRASAEADIDCSSMGGSNRFGRLRFAVCPTRFFVLGRRFS